MYLGYAQRRRARRSPLGFSLDEVVNAPQLQEALMRHTTKQPGGCWLWTGPKLSYQVRGRWFWRARLYVTLEKGYLQCSPARLAYLFDHGELPERRRITHTCHEPLCVRPDHVVLANQNKSYWSKVKPIKKQQEREEAARYWAQRAVAGISGETVEQIKFYSWLGESAKSIAKNFGIKQGVVEHILEDATEEPRPLKKAKSG